MIRHLLATSSILVLGSFLIAGPAPAQEKEFEQTKDSAGDKASNQQLPNYLRTLDLSDQQKQKIRDILGRYQNKVSKKWQQFHREHWQCIQLEAAMMAASNIEKDDASQGRGEARDSKNRSDRDNPPPQAGTKKDTVQKRTDRFKQTDKGDKNLDFDVMVMRVLIHQPNGRVREYYLFKDSDEPQEGNDFVRTYHSQLRKSWQRVHNLHDQLVRLQSQKMVAIEEVLTDQQREQLRAANRERIRDSVKDHVKEGSK